MNILLIDDDQQCLESLESALTIHGFHVESYESPTKAIKAFNPKDIDIVITDYHFEDIKGSEIISALQQKKNNVPVIVITGDRNKHIKDLCLKAGAYAFYKKPLSIKKMVRDIKAINSE